MRQKEQKLYDAFRDANPGRVWLQRIENLLGSGMPDIHYSGGGSVGWIELKAPIAPVRRTTRLLGTDGLNKDQINWHLYYAQHGGISWVLIRDDKRRMFLIRGNHAANMNDMTAAELESISEASSLRKVYEVISNYGNFSLKKSDN